MKKLRVFLISTGLVVLILLGLIALREEERDMKGPLGVWDKEKRCPITLVFDGKERPKEGNDGLGKWTVFISDSHGTAPDVKVGISKSIKPPKSDCPSCELKIKKIPGDPLEGVDWRIGHQIKKAEKYRGKKAKLSLKLKADQEIRFGAASVYMYDGVSVSGTSITMLNKKWREITVEKSISKAASTLEIWVRLTIHGTISNTGKVYFSDVQLNIGEVAHAQTLTEDRAVKIISPKISRNIKSLTPVHVEVDGEPEKMGEKSSSEWEVFVSDFHGTAPQIEVKLSDDVRPAGVHYPSCEMKITMVPLEPLDGVDWRIGHVVKDAVRYRGRNAQLKLKMKADRDITFGAASVYIYNGVSVRDVPIKKLGKNWEEFVVNHKISENSDTLEIWVRLTIHGTISAAGKVYFSDAKLNIL